MTLRCRGYDVQSAADGDAVLRYLRTGRPVSAVLLDIIMPNKDGFETLREIRETHTDLPVIMLSSMFSPLNVVQAMKCGATDFLPKPVGHEDLGRMIRQVTEGAGPQSLPAPAGDLDEDMFFGANARMRALRA